MKPVSLISTGVLLLLFGTFTPSYAQEEQHEQEAKPEKQEQQAKPQKPEQQAKPERQQQAKAAKPEQQAKPEKQQQAKAARPEQQAKPEKQQQAKTQQNQGKSQQHGQAQGQWARNGQKDSRGHEYSESRFGRDHHTRFEQNGGRFYNGRREYSYGGYWFYAGFYPPWFYQQDVYFIMGADGLWYAVAYGDPSLTFQVNIE